MPGRCFRSGQVVRCRIGQQHAQDHSNQQSQGWHLFRHGVGSLQRFDDGEDAAFRHRRTPRAVRPDPYCRTLKLTLLVSAPPGVVTTTGPVVAPLGTTAVMIVSEPNLTLVAATPLKVMLVVPLRPWPRIPGGGAPLRHPTH